MEREKLLKEMKDVVEKAKNYDSSASKRFVKRYGNNENYKDATDIITLLVKIIEEYNVLKGKVETTEQESIKLKDEKLNRK